MMEEVAMVSNQWVKTVILGSLVASIAGCAVAPTPPPMANNPSNQFYAANAPLTQGDKRISVLEFANQAAVSAYSYDYMNYNNELAQTSGYFSKTAWRNFKLALDESGNLNNVIRNKLVVSAIETGAPLITEERFHKYSRTHSWWVRVPLLVKYQSAYSFGQQHLLVQLNVVESTDVPGGLQVEAFIAKPFVNSIG